LLKGSSSFSSLLLLLRKKVLYFYVYFLYFPYFYCHSHPIHITLHPSWHGHMYKTTVRLSPTGASFFVTHSSKKGHSNAILSAPLSKNSNGRSILSTPFSTSHCLGPTPPPLLATHHRCRTPAPRIVPRHPNHRHPRARPRVTGPRCPSGGGEA
jgi:hypothetical protein